MITEHVACEFNRYDHAVGTHVQGSGCEDSFRLLVSCFDVYYMIFYMIFYMTYKVHEYRMNDRKYNLSACSRKEVVSESVSGSWFPVLIFVK